MIHAVKLLAEVCHHGVERNLVKFQKDNDMVVG
jgi:hypothetical protein